MCQWHNGQSERVAQTMNYLLENNLLAKFQSPYRQFHNTEIALVRVFNDILLHDYTPLALTSKRPSWRTTSKFRRSIERTIDGNSIVHQHVFFTFIFCS